MLLKTGLLRNFAVYMLKNYDFILFFYNTWFRIKNRRLILLSLNGRI